MKKLVVITGASAGIGAAIARKFSEQGHPLLLLARRVEPMEALGLPDSLCLSVDVTDQEAVRVAISQGEGRFGPIDLLVNCAGMMLLGRPESQKFSEWSAMIDVNIKGVLTTTAAVLKGMTDRNTGTIVNISSTAGRKTYDLHSVYCGTKFAVHAITETMRKEVSGSNVRMIVISPGMVDTELVSHTSDPQIVKDYNGWRRDMYGGLKPETVADCVSYAYSLPQEVCVREMVVAKTKQGD